MLRVSRRYVLFLLLLTALTSRLEARSGRYRCMWREDPATTMVVGWDQLSGSYPQIHYDEADFGRNADAYRFAQKPDVVIYSKGMNNCFARLRGLKPNTVYYFVIQDSEGVSRRMSFRTAPADPGVRLSIIAGGDSRNNREVRSSANQLVSKLRPTLVMFDGDMTVNDEAREWQNWFDDWQATIGSDGRVFPVVVARGNHEMTNQSLVDLFDVPNPDVYYALTIGKDLLRIYTLNSLIAPGGSQKEWLEHDLRNHRHFTWRFAQYHHSIRPHTSKKPEKDELLFTWATLFHEYRVQLVMESDAHVVKATWPIRPSLETGNDEGFVRDDETGTVYIGEGCWGAPLREADDNKSWTRSSGSFNQFKWIFIDRTRMEVRTVRTDGADGVAEVDHNNIFDPPLGLVLWSPGSGDVITIHNPQYRPVEAPVAAVEVAGLAARPEGEAVALQWTVANDQPGVTFEIQRSLDGGRTYSPIGTLRGGTGVKGAYSYQDEGLAVSRLVKPVSYRLRCIQARGAAVDYETELAPFSEPPPPPQPVGTDWTDIPRAIPDPASGRVKVKYELSRSGDVDLILVDRQFREVSRMSLRNQAADTYLKPFDLNRIARGEYLLIVKANGAVVKRYVIVKNF